MCVCVCIYIYIYFLIKNFLYTDPLTNQMRIYVVYMVAKPLKQINSYGIKTTIIGSQLLICDCVIVPKKNSVSRDYEQFVMP